MRPILRLFGFVPDPERELDEEIAAHLEMTEQALRRQGMGEREARAEARRRFGDVRSHRRAMIRLDEGRWRRMRIRERWDAVAYTLRSATRSALRNPGFSLAVISTLALGLGANAVMFGVVDRLLLSPPQHVAEPDQVRRMWVERALTLGTPGAERRAGRYFTWPDYEDLTAVEGFDVVAAYTVPRPHVLGHGESAEQVQVSTATPELFELTRTRPALGRFFLDEEDVEGGRRVVVLSHEYWTRAFGAAPEALGTRLEIGSEAWEVVGVAPPGFTGLELAPVDVWVPLRPWAYLEGQEGAFTNRNWWFIHTAVRLAPGASEVVALEQASALHVGGRTEAVASGSYDPEARILAGPLTQGGGPRPSAQAAVSKWLAAVSLIVLLIACANVANLLLARSTRLRQELSMRVALGASRARLMADLLTESLILAAVGAAAALGVARLGGEWLHSILLPNVAFVDESLGVRLFVFLGAATLLTAALAGIVPAVGAWRGAGSGSARSTRGATRRRSRIRVGLLVAQAALSVVLLAGAGLFVRSLGAASQLDLGYDADRVVLAEVVWNGTYGAAERADVYERARDRVRALPGVEAAATTYTIPFQSSVSIGRPRVAGLDEYPRPEGGGPYLNKVGAGYFETMGLTIVAGRGFEDPDDAIEAAPVAVVSAQMASDLWGPADPLGQCLHFGDESPCTRVVGVAEDHRRQSLEEPVPHHLYFLNLHHPDASGPPQGMMVRAADGVRPDLLSREIADGVRTVGGQIRFVHARPLFENIEPSLRSWRLGASMFTAFGLLSLIVAGIGLYSVLAFDVAQRRREMGVRAALGADRNRILAMVVRSALSLTALGLGVGLALAFATSRFLQPLLFRVQATDPAVYASVVGILLAVATVAALVPGWRATRIDPSEALRSE